MSERLWGLVHAAGAGARMQSAVPKQYLPLGSSCVLDVTLSRLIQLPQLCGIVVALSPGDNKFAEQPSAANPRISVTMGGGERADSVLRGLEYLHVELGAAEKDWVLVHDAARPCVRQESIQQLITTVLAAGRGGILAVPVADTLKREQEGNIAATVDRRLLWQAQTPQMFRLGHLMAALTAANAAGVTITDEASALEWSGEQPLLVMGRRDNIKITHADDLWLANQIWRGQQYPDL